jgi:acyl-CoA synthetase (AMP-forming)/AMP-acid ligase II
LERARALWGGFGIGEAVARAARLRPHAHALTVASPLDLRGFEGREWTTQDVARFVEQASAALELRCGVKEGQRVAVCAGNSVAQPLLCLAAMRLGAQAVPLNHQMKADELRYIIEDCGAQTLIADGRLWEEVARPALEGEGLGGCLERVLVTGPAPQVGEARGVRVQALWGELGGRLPALPARASGDEVCGIFYTSGTTGFPKGAMLTGESLLSGMAWALAIPGGGPRSLLCALPMAHIMGFATFLGAILGGARLVYLDRFKAREVSDWLASGEVDAFLGVPSMYQMLEADGALGRDLRGVKVFASAADVMPGGLIARFKAAGSLLGLGPARVPAVFVEAYGSVELGGAAMLRVSPPWVSPDEGGFVGWPLPGVKVEVRDEAGAALPEGQVGELWVQAGGVLRGYWGKEEATRETVQGGWLKTGDLASKERLGVVRFAGREKDVIKSGGYSVFPAELEAKLLEHPEVARAVVFGVEHPQKRFVPAAAVCLRPGARASEEELQGWIGARVARYKVPARVFVVEPEALPQGATGKVLKRQLQERYKGHA